MGATGRGVTLAYGARVVLHRADFTLPVGGLTALVGPNGSGKSTLLGAIAGLVPLAEGTVDIVGKAPVALVLQQTAANELLPITVREVVTLGRFAARGLLGRLRPADREAVRRAMAQLEVTNLSERHLRELSGGQRQRVLVAQGLAQEADVLLLDEPLTGLDLVSRQGILDALTAERAAGRTVIMSTHDLDDAELADHVLLLAGRVVAAGTPAQVLTAANLREAYGGRLLRQDGHAFAVDEHLHPETAAH